MKPAVGTEVDSSGFEFSRYGCLLTRQCVCSADALLSRPIIISKTRRIMASIPGQRASVRTDAVASTSGQVATAPAIVRFRPCIDIHKVDSTSGQRLYGAQ